MHGKFPFPEAKATTEILITGEKGGKQAGILIVSGLIGGIFDFLFHSVKLWSEVVTSKILPIGATLAEKSKIILKLNVSALIFSFGYLVGLKFATIIVVGSLLSWLVFIPLLNAIGNIIAGPEGVGFFAAMSPEDIFRAYVRPIGIGAIAMAGVIGIIKSSGVIGSAFKLAVVGLTGGKDGKTPEEIRTQKDIKMTFVIFLSLFTIIAIFIFLMLGTSITMTQAIIALATLVIIAFLFTTVAANAIAIVGTNPVSGMTLMTLIVSSIVLAQAGLQGPQGMVSALIIGGIVCTALSMAGGFITDLKIGYWLGSTPVKQESWKFLGTLVSAATVGVVIYILSQAYGFVKTDMFPDPLVAPQANAMAAVIEPLMLPGAQIHWMLFVVGAIIAILVNWLKISPLAFALGMFIPLDLNTPLIVGGLLAHYIGKSSSDEKLANARSQRGTLIASGFIAGAALFGVLGAFILFMNNVGWINLSLDAKVWSNGAIGSEILGLVMFILLIVYFVWETMRAKPDND
jgi:putative OPT family oligopeptide transporter